MAKRTASAKKQARAGVRRSARNRGVRSEVKTLVVKARRSFAESPVAESDRAALALAAIRALDRAASKGVLHRNNAARRKARLTRQLVKLGGSVRAPVKATAAKATTAKAAPAKGGGGKSAAPVAPDKGKKPSKK
jgi:small subunit ribosomal protein S20